MKHIRLVLAIIALFAVSVSAAFSASVSITTPASGDTYSRVPEAFTINIPVVWDGSRTGGRDFSAAIVDTGDHYNDFGFVDLAGTAGSTNIVVDENYTFNGRSGAYQIRISYFVGGTLHEDFSEPFIIRFPQAGVNVILPTQYTTVTRGTQYSVLWDGTPGEVPVVGYRVGVYHGDGTMVRSPDVGELITTNTFSLDTSKLEVGQYYSVRVFAVGANGTSIAFGVSWIMTVPVLDVPPKIRITDSGSHVIIDVDGQQDRFYFIETTDKAVGGTWSRYRWPTIPGMGFSVEKTGPHQIFRAVLAP